MKRYYCTYFDRNYLVKGLALIESLNEHENQDYELFVVCMDEITRALLTRLELPHVTTIPMHLIEQGDSTLLAAKHNRSLVEYYWTTTPTIILKILEDNPNIDTLTYLDADLFFFSSPDPIFEEFGNNAVLIHEHRFSPTLMHLEQFGKYNVGLLSFRNDSKGLEALKWWRERCIEWCFETFEEGKYGDQLYLNDWPVRFKKVHVLQHIGGGVAPWNHFQYRFIKNENGLVFVDDKPLIFYHFHGLRFAHPDLILPAVHFHPLTEEILRLCFLPYIRSLNRNLSKVRTIFSDFSFGLEEKDILTSDHTFLVRKRHTKEIESSGTPQYPIHLDEEWDCFCSRQFKQIAERPETGIDGAHDKTSMHGDLNGDGNHYRLETPETAEDLNQRGEKLFEEGDMDGALEAFKNALKKDSRFATAHNNLGVLYAHMGRIQDAIEQFSKALKIAPDDPTTVLNCGRLFVELDHQQDAKAIYSSYLQRFPNDREITEELSSLSTTQ